MATATDSIPMTLERKVRAALTDKPGELLGYPVDGYDYDLSELEMDFIEWGFALGIAFGITRAHDPFEPREEVVKRALEAADCAWRDYSRGDDDQDRRGFHWPDLAMAAKGGDA